LDLFDYSARDDVLLNRPWVLYFAALIVWSYGFALEGQVSNVNILNSPTEQARDARLYLQRFGSVESPEALKSLKGLNECAGMLLVLRESFRKTRWELLHEAANLLTNCVDLLNGRE
jgi:hypothetical protein